MADVVLPPGPHRYVPGAHLRCAQLLANDYGAVACGYSVQNPVHLSIPEEARGEPAPQPLALSLPQVPDGAVALVGAKTGQRYVIGPLRGAWYIEATALPLRNDYPHELHDILFTEGSVTVVMREPRTWPRLDGAPADLKAVRGASGMAYRLEGGLWRADDGTAECDSLPSLQNYDGPLREVLDARA